MKTAKEILEKVETHDQPILDLLMVDRNKMTLIQLSNHFKRSRLDMRGSIERLSIGKHIYQTNEYGKWAATNYDFTREIIAKRPDEAASQMKALKEEVAKLKDEKAKLLQLSERVVYPALVLARQDYPMSSLAAMAVTDWKYYIESIRDYPFA